MALVNPGIALSVENFKVPNMLGMAAEAENIQNKQVTRQAAQQEMQNAQYAQAMKQSRDALSFVRTPEEYIAWSESNYRDPLLGGFLQKMGMTPEKTRSQITTELQKPGGLERLIQQSAASTAQLTDIMSGRLNAMAAERKAQAGQAQNAAQQAQIDAIIGRGASAAAPGAPTAQAFPVAPPVDTGVYEPGTPRAINQMYAQARGGQTPALNALANPPAGVTADPRMAQLTALREAQIRGNARAGKAADILEAQIKSERALSNEIDPSKRYLNVGGGGGIFDVVERGIVEGTKSAPKVGTPVPIIGPTGDVILVPPEEAIGKTPGSQAEKIPKDFRRKPDGSLGVIPGSPTDIKNKENAKVGEQTIDAAIANIDKLIGPVGEYKEHPGLRGATGPINVRLPTLSTDTANAEAYIQSLQAKASLEGLRTIRGQAGAIGQITEKEWPRLENLLATLQASQGTPQFAQSLNEYRSALLDVKNQIRAASAGGAGAKTGGATVSVTAPNGRTYTFANQKAADDFKKAAGIQ